MNIKKIALHVLNVASTLLFFWLIYLLGGWFESTFFAAYWVPLGLLGITVTFVTVMWLFTLVSSYDTANGITTATMLLLPGFTGISILSAVLVGVYYLIKYFVGLI